MTLSGKILNMLKVRTDSSEALLHKQFILIMEKCTKYIHLTKKVGMMQGTWYQMGQPMI